MQTLIAIRITARKQRYSSPQTIMLGTNPLLAVALLTHMMEFGKLGRVATETKQSVKFPLGKDAKIRPPGKASNVGNDLLGKGKKTHDLGHASAGKAGLAGDFGFGKLVI